MDHLSCSTCIVFIISEIVTIISAGVPYRRQTVYALRKELVGSGKITSKQYHDAVLHLKAMPVEMFRASLTNQPITPDVKTSWKFYGK